MVTLVGRPGTTNFGPYIDRAKHAVWVLDSLVASTDSLADVVRIDSAAGKAPVTVSPQTIGLLATARDAWRISGGRLDATSPPLVKAMEQRERVHLVQNSAERDSLRALVDLAAVSVDVRAHTVFLPRAGTGLDLALMARGRNLDIARVAFPPRAFSGGVIQVGPSALAFGRPPRGPRWQIALAPPNTGRASFGIATIDSGAVYVVSDSGPTRFPVRNQIRLVDARTGERPTAIGSVIVIAPTAEFANAVAAALYMLTPERARAVADSLGVAAIVVRPRKGSAPIGPRDVLLSAAARRFVRLVPELQPVRRPAGRGRAAAQPARSRAVSASTAAGGV
ncbi:MAG: FAD:protein FMN transferase [Gemmatimonadota bacterium]|nr:FAD:protein FMN transferase [Gemmatimonadota bacterium]